MEREMRDLNRGGGRGENENIYVFVSKEGMKFI